MQEDKRMNIPKHAMLMFGVLFTVSVVVDVYTGWLHSMPLQEIIAGDVLSGVVLGLGGAVLYSLGVRKASYRPTTKAVAIHGLFSYCLACSASTLFGLAAVSWFLFAALVAGASFVSAIRLKSVGAGIGLPSNK